MEDVFDEAPLEPQRGDGGSMASQFTFLNSGYQQQNPPP